MVPHKRTVLSIALLSLFLLSSVAPSFLIAPTAASPSSPASLAASPLSQLEASWAAPDGNQFNQNFNPQKQINSSNVQNLGLNWIFPLPTHPTALISVGGGLGVDTAPLIINGTVYFVTQFDQVFALNAANGNVLWTDVLPITPNSTAGRGIGAVGLHHHDGSAQFTTKWTAPGQSVAVPTFWIAATDWKVYAINALNGKYLLNFSIFDGVQTVQGTHTGAQYGGGVGAANLLVDQNRGLVISSAVSPASPNTGRCFYRGWDVTVSPPKMIWETYCTPPQPSSNISVDPNWDIKQVNSMKGAEIFYPGPQYHNGGAIPGTSVVDLKKLSADQLNATLYDDWGYVNQTPACKAATGGLSSGSTAAGWGAPWLLGVGPTAGWAFVNTNNPDPYNSPCVPGPELWSASVLALNETNGNWIWGFQTSSHDVWDLDCSWWQGLGNETVSGVNTQVLWKLCKDGYMYELNAQTGSLIWAYTPPIASIPRCPKYCDLLNPLNRTQMTEPYFAPDRTGAGVGTAMYPGLVVGESESSFSPTLNYIFFADEVVPSLAYYVPPNATNYKTNSGMANFAPNGGNYVASNPASNATISAVDASTGQLVWSYFVPVEGYRGGLTNSGNVVYATLSSGDLLMINAQTGKLIRDYYIGGPLNVLTSVGATANGDMELIFPITAGIVTWGTGIPGDVVALKLQSAVGGGSTITATSTTTAISTSTTTVGAGQTATTTVTVGGGGGQTVTTTVNAGGASTTITATGGGGIDPTTFYGVAVVAVIFVIATGFLAMRGRSKAGP